MHRLLGLFLILASALTSAHIQLQKIESHNTLEVQSFGERLRVGDRLAFMTPGTNPETTAVAIVKKVSRDTESGTVATVEVRAHSELILKTDKVRKVNLDGADPSYPGRADLLISDDAKVSARYKTLVYLGTIAGRTAATLNQGEYLLSLLGNLHYGITDRFMVSTFVFYDITAAANLTLEYNVVKNDTFRLTPALQGLYNVKNSVVLPAAQLFLDTYSNSKFVSHTALTVYLGDVGRVQLGGDPARIFLRSTVQSAIEYVYDNWNRLLVGPLYNLNSSSFGGFISYMWIWDRFHLSIGLRTEDFQQFKIGPDNYYPYIDVFWRF